MQLAIKQQGAVLTMTLLLMAVLTGLVLTALSNTVLGSKMSRAWSNQLQAFTVAEAGLLAAESGLDEKTLSVPLQGAALNTEITLQGNDSCQRPWYLIKVAVTYQGASITLESAYKQARMPRLPECATDHFTSQRLWWRQLS